MVSDTFVIILRLIDKVQEWFQICSSVPKSPAWRKRMEHEAQTGKVKAKTHFMDQTTKVSLKLYSKTSVCK